MHAEFCMLSAETAALLNQTRQAGGRIVCVGTTSCRTIESFAKRGRDLHREVRLD